MSTPDAVAVLDMDGVLLTLPLDTDGLRAAAELELRGAGMTRQLRPFMQPLEASLLELATRAPERADALRARIWGLIDAEERRAAELARPIPGARAMLDRLQSAMPVALYTNNDEQAARRALTVVGVDPTRFFAVQARTQPRSLKPSPTPLQTILDAAGPGVRRLYFVGDHPWDMQSAVQAQRSLRQVGRADVTVIGVALLRSRWSAEILGREGASFVARDHAEVADWVLADRARGDASSA